MIITAKYRLVYDSAKKAQKVMSEDTPLCPQCGFLLSGYDYRIRKAIDSAGIKQSYIVRRLQCPKCLVLHVELPDFMLPNKHYQADVIETATKQNKLSDCPADDSTIRRWKNQLRK